MGGSAGVNRKCRHRGWWSTFQFAGCALLLAVTALRGVAAESPGDGVKAVPGSPAAPAARPNIVVILADDMGLGDVGCYGGTSAPTPNLDRLAAEGTRFTHYYSAAPICSPSRAGMITGGFPARWKITSFLQTRKGNADCEQADFLDPAAPSLPRALKAAGYATAHFGKWHLGGGRDVADPPKFAAYGYDEHAGTYESPEPDPNITATNWIWSDKDKVKRWERTGYFVDKTLDFLKRNAAGRNSAAGPAGPAAEPCFVNMWLDDPHTPWVPGPDAPKGDTPANLRGVLVELDRQVGRFVAGLKEMGLEKDTLVIFASDNGPLPNFRRQRTTGLRGSKLSLYDGGTRLPFIARQPGTVPAGRVDDQTVLSGVDLLPTLCGVAGAPVPEGATLDGQDMSAALAGTAVVERKAPLFWEYGRNEKSFGYPKPPGDRSPNVAVRDGKWVLLVNADGTKPELYDTQADPEEETNVAAKHPAEAERLTAAALKWRKGLP
jgi:arylsulfatase A-like enzyme